MRIALVGCGKKKANVASKARDLYTGPLFKASLRYADATCDRVFVLSAKHGLVELDQVVEPYDLCLADLSVEERAKWGIRVPRDLACRIEGAMPRSEKVTLVGLAGAEYLDALALPDFFPMIRPLDGKQIGERLQWLKQNAPASDPARELASEILEWEAQFGPTSDDDTNEVSGEDFARWVRLARQIKGEAA